MELPLSRSSRGGDPSSRGHEAVVGCSNHMPMANNTSSNTKTGRGTHCCRFCLDLRLYLGETSFLSSANGSGRSGPQDAAEGGTFHVAARGAGRSVTKAVAHFG